MSELLKDPVCGMQISKASPCHSIFSGEKIYFCSEACRMRFITNPLDFVDIHLPKRDVYVPVLALPLKDVLDESFLPIPAKKNALKYDRSFELLLGGWVLDLIAPMIIAWRESRYAARTSRELLKLFRDISIKHSELAGRELYRLLVIARTGCDNITANVTLKYAEESFASWPVKRELTLCDVVRYLTVSEFVSLRKSEKWIHSNVQHAVVSRIPHNLCIFRRRE